MAKKRGNGEGCIYKEGNRWRGSISIDDSKNGKSKRKQFYGKTKKSVLERMEQYKADKINGKLLSNEKITLDEWFKAWLFDYRRNDLKPSSFERYELTYRLYIKNSKIGNIKLKDLRTTNLQSYYNLLLEEKNKSVPTIKTINKHLKTCLTQALKENYISKNYCTLVTLPKKDITCKDTITFFALDEQKQFIEALEGHRLKAFFLLALGTGLRLGELMALTWDDIDFINGTVSVNKNFKSVKLFNDDSTYKYDTIVQPPKTVNSIRTVPIPKNILKTLIEHRTNQKLEKLKNINVYVSNDLIFCSPIGTYLDESNIRKQYTKLLKNAEVEYKKFHSLRHTYATRLFENDVPIKTVQVLMGHRDIQTTMNTYTHVVDEVKNEAVEKLNMLF